MKKILFVEDEAVMQKALGEFLQANGYEVISALDGEVGLSLAKSQAPDLILLDIILPKKDGFEVFKELKADEKTEAIPVVVLTNLSQMNDVSKMLELGGTKYFVKSEQSLQDILAIVKDSLGEK
jgi:DNA-binding response OmpR family regulator